MQRLLLPLLLILALAACAKAPVPAPLPGVTTLTQAKQLYGPPLGETAPIARPQVRLIEWTGFQAQVEGELIMQYNREPLPEERTLQYWRHRWKGSEQRFTEIPNTRDVHGHVLRQLVSVRTRTAVIYDATDDRVIRVVRYATR